MPLTQWAAVRIYHLLITDPPQRYPIFPLKSRFYEVEPPKHEYICAWLPWNYGYETNYSFVVFLLWQKTNLTIFKRNCFTLVLRIFITIIPAAVLNRQKIIRVCRASGTKRNRIKLFKTACFKWKKRTANYVYNPVCLAGAIRVIQKLRL